MTVEKILQYDDIIKAILDQSNIDSKTWFRFLNMRKQFEPIIANFQQAQFLFCSILLKKHKEMMK